MNDKQLLRLIEMTVKYIQDSEWKKYYRISFNKHFELVYSGHSHKFGLWIPEFFDKDSRVITDYKEMIKELRILENQNKFNPIMLERWLWNKQ